MVLAGDHVGDDFRVLRIRNAGFENPDDRGRARVKALEANGFTDDGRILLEGSGPETIGQDNHASGFGAVVLGTNQTPKNGVETHDLEIAPVNNSSSNFARFTKAHHCKTNPREVSKFRNRLDASLKVLDIRNGEQGILHAHAGCALADIDK